MSRKEIHIGLSGGESRKAAINLNEETPVPWDLDTELRDFGND